MPSAIDATKPVDGVAAFKDDLRANLAAAKTEIEALQGAVVTDGTTARTFALGDAYDYIRFTSGSAVTATVPPNSSVVFDIGTVIAVRQAGAGVVTLAPGSGVTLNPPPGGSLATSGQGSTVQIKKVATDVWDVI